MLRYIIRRLGYMSVTLILVAIVGFIIIELPPGSYMEFEIERIRALGGDINTEMIKALELKYGVNDPLYLKFWKWIRGFAHGDFGIYFEYWVPVSTVLWSRLWITVWTSLLTMAFQWVAAIFIGVYSATHRYTAADYGITVLQFIGLSVPNFLLALVLMIFTQRVLHWDVGGLQSQAFRDAPASWAKFVDMLKHLWLPIVVVGANGTAWLSRVMRANLLDVLNMQYVQTARAKGLKENTVIWKHAVRNAMHALIMVLGGSLPGIISGETVVAIVLNMPTTGPLYFNALLSQDMYLAVSFLMFLAILLVVGNLLADILLAYVDPRIRYE
jgi:peptide/nickel transport system permease protein